MNVLEKPNSKSCAIAEWLSENAGEFVGSGSEICQGIVNRLNRWQGARYKCLKLQI